MTSSLPAGRGGSDDEKSFSNESTSAATRLSNAARSTATNQSNNLEIKVPQSLTQQTDVSFTQDEQSVSTFVPQNVIWGTNVITEKCRKSFMQFIRTFRNFSAFNSPSQQDDESAENKIYLQALEECHLVGHTCLIVDCMHLKSHDAALYKQLVNYPREILPIFDHVINEIFREIYATDVLASNSLQLLQTRPFNASEECCRSLRLLEPTDLDKFVSVMGMITRVSPIIPEMQRAFYECEKCQHFEVVDYLASSGGRFVEPQLCSHCQTQNLFKLIHNKSLFADRQLMKLQEDPNTIPSGETPHSILLAVHDDLVDSVQPGDRVNVCGIYKAWSVRANPKTNVLRSVYRTYVDVLHFEKSSIYTTSQTAGNASSTSKPLNNIGNSGNEDEIRFTDADLERIKEISELPDVVERLAECLAPGVFGYHDIKKGLLLQLLGGTEKQKLDETTQQQETLRSEINILLCGDPGTSKSQLLKYIYDLIPRSQYTSGKGSSAVGLTAYVTKDPDTKNLVLQSGALVLADNGICCIDEFDKMSDHVRSVLHEVMEQQTMSIAKAGIICTLNARVAILAAANPVDSHWNPKKTIIDNLQLPSTLLSRFDLIFLVLDPQSEEHDTNLATHLVSLFSNLSNSNMNKQKNVLTRPDEINEEDLKKYISYAKSNIKPQLSKEASELLISSYVDMRQLSASHGHVSAFPRQLESLIRLSEAHAKCRLSNSVTAEDVNQAIGLHKEAIRQSATDPTTGKIDVSILTTGLSAYKRKMHREIANSIRQIIDSIGRSRLSAADVYENLSSNSDALIKRGDFDSALKILESEGYIKSTPNGQIRIILNSI